MAHQLETAISLGRGACVRLREGAQQLGASEAELAAIDRLEAGSGQTVDVERLAPIAFAIGLPWSELFEGLVWKSERAQ